MRLVIDSQIPFMKGHAERLGEVIYKPGAEIDAATVREADALIVRTRTRCDRKLLEGSKVKFIASATIGFDHIDTAYLAEKGIAWTNCPGCNADSVAQYVETALLQLVLHGWNGEGTAPTPVTAPLSVTQLPDRFFADKCLAVVGVGHVGSKVVQMAQRLGFGEILLCDPPREEVEGSEAFVSLEEAARRADVITFHTPLTRKPTAHSTFHLADTAFFEKLSRRPVLINSSRGEVVETEALKKALCDERIAAAVIDTWENEPNVDRELLRSVFIATPHIAGYSADGKANGTRMALTATARFFGLDEDSFGIIAPPPLPEDYAYFPEGEGRRVSEALRRYDPAADHLRLLRQPELFEKWRGNYPLRRE
ncbi:MAG: 4-phosphoerythronate dehydrogenase [Alloprevotella sp.]